MCVRLIKSLTSQFLGDVEMIGEIARIVIIFTPLAVDSRIEQTVSPDFVVTRGIACNGIKQLDALHCLFGLIRRRYGYHDTSHSVAKVVSFRARIDIVHLSVMIMPFETTAFLN